MRLESLDGLTSRFVETLTPVEARTHTIILLNEYPSIKSSLKGSYSRRLLSSVKLVIKALSCQDTHIRYEVK